MDFPKSVVDLMKPGDIIQIHIPGKWFPWNMYYWSHTLMYVGDNNLVHSGVVQENIYTYFDKHTDIDNFTVLRVKGVTAGTLTKVVVWTKAQIGKPFDMWSLYRLTKQIDPPSDHPGYGFYCTELIWAAYFSQANIDLDKNHIGWINPMEIYMNTQVSLVYIKDKWAVPLPWKRLWLW